ncbi:MAG: restriction endonuclease subunit S [Chloroflexi bacterium]|nr:restriction endonuclease subunit S [Chloroflexota bacterium]
MERFELPDGWQWAPLADVAQIGAEQVFPKREPTKQFNYIALENIESGTGCLTNFAAPRGSEIGSNKYRFTNKHVLYGKLRPYLRKAFLPEFDGISATDLLPLLPNDNVLERRFLFQWLLSPFILEYVVAKQTGVKMPRLRTPDLESLPVPIPPLPEQHRIVKKIESLFAEARTARAALDRAEPLLKKFRQAVLSAAFRGELTERDANDEPASLLLERIRAERREKWEADLRAKGQDPTKAKYVEAESPDTRELGELPKGWVWVSLSEVAEIRNGVTKGRDLARYKTLEVPYLRVANVQDGYLDLRAVKTIKIKEEELEKYRLKRNDVLFTEGGDRDKLGRGTIWHDEISICVHQNHIHCARLVTQFVLPEWITFASTLSYARDYFWNSASQTVNLASLNATSLKAFCFPLAPVAEQQRIVERIEALFTQAEQIEHAVEIARRRAEQVEQAILARAFRGEL